tara:strand:+ start:999 stop:2198 length:1200 start_codon:yes stop_codon:yes gene_type:complete
MERRTFIQALATSTYGVKAYANAPVADNVKAKNIIYIYLDGGMSHIDTFDPKDDKEVMGDTEKIITRGDFQIGNRLPKLAEVMNKAVVIRSTTSKTGAHQQAQYLSRTSYKQLGTITHPSLGSWVSHVSNRDKAIPDFVLVNGISTHPGSGFLPKSQSPLPIVDPKDGLKNSKVDDKLQERMALLKVINKKISAPIADTYNEFYDDTVRFLKSKDLELFDISKEPATKRERYGTSRLGQGLLLAKRLVRGDIKFIEVSSGGWDTHTDNFTKLDDRVKELDDGVSALVEDLESEGLLDSTLIVIATEFGRTPKINVNTGRDHYPKAYSTVLIGAGVKGGMAYGETDDTASKVIKDSATISDINATVAHLAGLNVKKEYLSPTGRPFELADKGKIITSILS